jgi:hypothetical protein
VKHKVSERLISVKVNGATAHLAAGDGDALGAAKIKVYLFTGVSGLSKVMVSGESSVIA